MHCSYCLGKMKRVIRKLRSFSHTERSYGIYVDPNWIYTAVSCGKHLWKGNVTYEEFVPPELVIPEDKCDFLWWRMPFKDLQQFNLSQRQIKKYTPPDCNLPVNGEDGIWRPFQ